MRGPPSPGSPEDLLLEEIETQIATIDEVTAKLAGIRRRLVRRNEAISGLDPLPPNVTALRPTGEAHRSSTGENRRPSRRAA